MQSVANTYQERIQRFQADQIRVKRQVRGIALLRLIFFLGFATGIYACFRQFQWIGLFLTVILFAAFIWLVNLSTRFNFRSRLLRNLIFVNRNELDVMEEKLNGFDPGLNFLNAKGYAQDLDVFGSQSLFHLLNRTTTRAGREELAHRLKNPMLQITEIEDYQQAVQGLCPQLEERQMLIALGLMKEEESDAMASLTQWLQVPGQLLGKPWIRIICVVLPLANLAGIFYYLWWNDYLPLISGVIISWVITGIFGKYIHHQHALIGKKQDALDQYGAILNTFGKMQPGNSSLLRVLQLRANEAGIAVHKLSRLSQFFDQRLNTLIILLLNSLMMYDIQCMLALEKWKEENRSRFAEWMDALGKIEYLNSLAGFAFNNPEYCFPKVSSGTGFIETEAIAHPLIPASRRVANDFLIGKKDRLQLITGSNMSGKTTFLRTIGINLLLAQGGAPVCAASFSFAPMAILSSIRISDSLQENTSFFMAELKRLQTITRELESGRPALVLVDEILRGTNSEDKHFGSAQFIRRLIQYDCLSLFATHDLGLHVLAEEFPQHISNYCFESSLSADELYFDYKIQRGIARNKNASFLMKKMNII